MNHSLKSATLAGLAATLLASAALAQTPLTTVRVASGFQRPIYVGAPPGDEDRLFVAEQWTGAIKIIKNGTVLGTPFLDIGGLATSSEQGLLAMAFHPDYANNGHFYIMYTRTGGDTMVERYTAPTGTGKGNPDVAIPGSRQVIMGPISQNAGNHNGGTLAFSPNDGYLYLSLGDGGSSGDPGCRAQNGQELLGKIVRIDPSVTPGVGGYAIPASNPFVGNPEFFDVIWTYGWRNPWRASFDRATGDMWVGDVGQNRREEISFQAGTSTGGENFGWKIKEGTTCFGTAGCTSPLACSSPMLVDPVHDYAWTGGASAIGGYVYRGCAIPDLVGTYFFADYSGGRIWSFRYDGSAMTEFQNRKAELAPGGGLAINRIVSFGEDGRGEIHIVDLQGGEIFKIVANTPSRTVNLGGGVASAAGGEVPLFEVCGLASPGDPATFILRKAPASSPAALLLSTQNNPAPLFGGTLHPIPALLVLAVGTDPNGRFEVRTPRGLPAAVLYGQFAVVDSQLGIGLSNGLQITWP